MRLQEFYRSQFSGRRVLLTGHTGFKGSWMLYWLHQLGAEVRGLALPAEQGQLYDLIDGDGLCDSVRVDIRDAAAVREVVADFQPEFLFHLAAQSLVGVSYESPLQTFDANVMGTANCLDGARSIEGGCSIVVVTTDKVYENLEMDRPFAPSDKLGGHDPYSASKACTEIVTDSYRKSFFPVSDYSRHGVAVATARAGNVIGGGDWNRDHLVPDIVRSLAAGSIIPVRNPSAVRPWQHVLEPLSGYLTLALHLRDRPGVFSRGWNFGPDLDDNVTVESFVQRAIAIWGGGSYEDVHDPAAPHEATLLRLDISETRDVLGWHPLFTVDAAIERTLRWYREYNETGAAARSLVAADLQSYLDAASAVSGATAR